MCYSDTTPERLARKVIDKLKSVPESSRIVIGIAGVPGSGKTTIGSAVCALVNQYSIADSSNRRGPSAISIPMDGFHYSREHLAAMPDPVTAIHRRGAAFTFDGLGFHSLIKSLTDQIEPNKVITAPSFDHAVKDPIADSIFILPVHRVVLVEGNYCALNRDPWKSAAKLMTELWYLDIAKEVVWARLAKRHLASGIVHNEQEAIDRAKGTDELNAQDIRQNLLPVDEIIV